MLVFLKRSLPTGPVIVKVWISSEYKSSSKWQQQKRQNEGWMRLWELQHTDGSLSSISLHVVRLSDGRRGSQLHYVRAYLRGVQSLPPPLRTRPFPLLLIASDILIIFSCRMKSKTLRCPCTPLLLPSVLVPTSAPSYWHVIFTH